MRAPTIVWRAASNCSSMNLPQRLELSLRTVRALPNASRIGLDWSTYVVAVLPEPPPLHVTAKQDFGYLSLASTALAADED